MPLTDRGKFSATGSRFWPAIERGIIFRWNLPFLLSSWMMSGSPWARVRDITERKKAEEEIKRYVEDLERFNRLVVGREEKMIQLKSEINELKIMSGQSPKYRIVE